MSDLIERLEAQGADAFHKHYSLGMWQLCAEAAAALRAAAEREARLVEALGLLRSVRMIDNLSVEQLSMIDEALAAAKGETHDAG